MSLMHRVLYVIPRSLAISITIFFAVFILEGFGPEATWIDLIAHCIVAVAVLAATVIAWRWPDTGGWLFLIVGIYYLRSIFSEEWWNGLIIGGIPLLTGFLFLADGMLRDRYPDLWMQHVETKLPRSES